MNKLIVEPSPHIRSGNTTTSIMLNVIIALIPALIASIYYFGIRSLILVLVCVLTCILSEYIFRKITKRENTASDLSAAVTGVILAFNLPVTLPLYMAVIGSIIAVVIVKQMFGGIGQNFANPAIVARIVLMLSFTSHMSNFVQPFYYKNDSADLITGATPLPQLINAETGVTPPTNMELFLGNHGGSLGETCAIAILIGFIYLIITKVINPITPIAFVGSVALFTFIAGGNVLAEILAGGLLFGAVFMATDYATTPLTPKGKLIFGIGCGLVTFVIRYYSSMPEGVSFAILLMNILTPYIDRITLPKPYGHVSEKKNKEVKI